MLGLSLFGVTPGYTKRDILLERERLPPIIESCSNLYLLDQFSVSVAPDGSLNVLGGKVVRGQAVSFIGTYRHAVELGGNRTGGHYGAGIWMVDDWLDARDVASAIDRAMTFIRQTMIDGAGQFIRTFDQVDLSGLRAILSDLDEYRVGPPKGQDDVFPALRSRKILLTGSPEDDERPLIDFIRFVGERWALLRDRVIYVSGDSSIVNAIRRLKRLDIDTIDHFTIENTEGQRRRTVSGQRRTEEVKRAPSVETFRTPVEDQETRISIPVRNGNGRSSPSRDETSAKGSRWQKVPNTSRGPSSSRVLIGSTAMGHRLVFGGAVLASITMGIVAFGNSVGWLEDIRQILAQPRQPSIGIRPSTSPGVKTAEQATRPVGAGDAQEPPSPSAKAADALAKDFDGSVQDKLLTVHGAKVLCIPVGHHRGPALRDYLRSDASAFLLRLQATEAHVHQILQSGDKSGTLSKSDLEMINSLIAREQFFRDCLSDTVLDKAGDRRRGPRDPQAPSSSRP